MSNVSSGREPLEKLAEEFAERFRRGERPALTEYVQKYPELAEDIRELFPALVEMEDLRPAGNQATSPYGRVGGVGAPVPEQLGDYRILREVAHGGMGIVYEAVQESLGRHVALKVLPFACVTNPHYLERFRRESRAAAKLHHTNIVPVFGVGEHEGVHYYAMQFIQGQSLDCVLYELKRLRRDRSNQPSGEPGASAPGAADRKQALSASIAQGLMTGQFKTEEAGQAKADSDHSSLITHDSSLPALHSPSSELTTQSEVQYYRSVVQVGVQVADALAYAHQQGILHRDIKPSNLLLDTQGTVWVTDFGLVKEEGSGELTSPGDIVGTLRYMAPERFQGQADARSDVYGLGLTLYEMLTLTPAFEDTDRARLMDRVQHEEPPRPRKLDPRIPRDLETIVLKATAKEPSGRYATATALAEDLRRFLADRPIQARRTSAWERTWRWCRRNPAVASLTAIVLALLAVGVVVLAISNVLITREKNQKDIALQEKDDALTTADANYREAREQETLAKNNEGTAKAQELLARRRFYAAQMNLAMQAWEAGQAVRVLALLESQRPKVDEDDLRTFEWYYLWRLCQGGLRHRFPMIHYDNGAPMALSPDGHTLASGFDNTIKLWDTITGREKGTLPGPHAMVDGLAFTPDGKTLVSSDSVTIRVWDLATGKERKSLTPGPVSEGFLVAGDGGLAIAGDGNTLVLGGPTTVTLWDLTTGRQVSLVASGSKHRYRHPTISPNGRTVAAFCDDGTVKVWARDGDSWRQWSTIHGHGWPYALAFSPDGKVLAIGAETVKCYDPATGQVRLTLSGHNDHLMSVSISANGKVLASAGRDQTARLWDAAMGRQLACLAHPGIVYGAALSADGKVVATACGDIRVWDATPLEEAVVLPHAAAVSAVAFSRDGQTLASAGGDGTKLWHPGERKVVSTLPASQGLAFSPDGKTLAIGNRSGGAIEIWSVAGERRAVLQGHAKPARSLAFSPDGKSLASASSEPEAILWDLRTRQPRAKLKIVGEMSAVAFSPDGKTLAAGSQFGAVKLFEAATGRESATLQRYELAGSHTHGLAFSSDSKLLAASNLEGLVQVWETATGRLHAALKGHVGTVWSLSFAPDGRTLATAGYDRTIKLWDVATGQERCTLKGHKGIVFTVAFAPDGNTLVTGSGDGTVRLWPTAVDAKARARKEELEAEVQGTPAAHNEQGDALWQYGRTAEAESAYSEALARLEKLAATFPDSAGLRQEMIRSLLSRALLLEQTGRPAEAARASERAREIYRNLSANDQQALIWGYRERGRKLASIGNRQQAERTYSQAVELAPTSETARLWRASNYTRLGQWDKAAAEYTKAIELKRDSWEAWSGRAFVHFRRQQWDKAISDFSKAIDLAPHVHTNWWHRGHVYLQLAQWDKAAADFGKVVDQWPDGAEGWYLRGQAYGQLGQWDKALADYFRAIELAKDNEAFAALVRKRLETDFAKALQVQEKLASDFPAVAQHRDAAARMHHHLGSFLEAKNEPKEAEQHFAKAAAIWEKLGADVPGKPVYLVHAINTYLYNLGSPRLSSGRNREAEEAFRTALKLLMKYPPDQLKYPDDPQRVKDCLSNLLVILISAQRLPEAEAVCRQSIELWSKYAKATSKGPFFEISIEQGLAGLHADLARVLKVSDRSPEQELAGLHADLARLLTGSDRPHEAVKVCSRAIEKWPDIGALFATRGRAYRALQQPENALRDFSKAIELAPNDGMAPWWHLDRSWTYEALKQDDKALAELSQAIERWPNLWDAWIWRGEYHQHRGQWKQAIADYSKGLELNPNYEPGWHARGVAQYHIGDWKGAVASLTKSADLQKDWFLLAMAQWKLDQKKDARQSYERAVQWMEKNAPQNEELRRLRAEAAELLGVKEKKE